MSTQNTTTAVTTRAADKDMEFVPFGAADKIKLSVAIIQKLIAVPTRSGKTCSDVDAMKFMMLCQAQRLNPFAGDVFLTGYDGKDGAPPKFALITAHVAFLKRAESSPDFEGMESGVIIENEGVITEREGDFYLPNETVVGGWAKVYRKGRKPTYRRLAIEQRKPNYNTSFWEPPKHAEQIVKCAEADALRASFPTLLGGLHGQGEVTVIDVTPANKELADRPVFTAIPATTAKQAVVQETAAEGGMNLPKAIRGLLAGSGLTEDAFLAYLKSGLALFSSCHTLEQAVAADPTTLRKMTESWGEVEKEMKA